MLILYAALKYDNGNPAQVYSFKRYNLHGALSRMGHDIIYFDLGSLVNKLGREAMNRPFVALCD